MDTKGLIPTSNLRHNVSVPAQKAETDSLFALAERCFRSQVADQAEALDDLE